MPRKRLVNVIFVLSVICTYSLRGQEPSTRPARMPDSAQMSAMMGAAIRRMQPAQFVLDHRAELALTPEQIPYLESLVLAQADSARVRNARRLANSMSTARDPMMARASSAMMWTGPVDEEAIREMARKQAEMSTEIQIDMARDRHAVGAVLTTSQVSMLMRLEAADMTNGVRVMGLINGPVPSGYQPYFEFQVDKQVAFQPGTPLPRYPESLRASGTVGTVLAQFVVDSAGRYVDGSLKILKTDNALFTQAIRDALPLMQFVPAEVRGAKVRQLVQRPFTFSPDMK